jgi:hypothetical protein
MASWVVMPCNLKNAIRFVAKYDFHIQGRRVSQSRKRNQSVSLTTAGFLPDLPFDAEDGRDVSPNFRDFSELQTATTHKTVNAHIENCHIIKKW